MKFMNPKKVEVGKVYLCGDSDGFPSAIIWLTGKNKGTARFWGRMLSIETRGSHSIFFSFGSFLGPDQYNPILRELTKEELEPVEKMVIDKLKGFFGGNEPIDEDLGIWKEAEVFRRSLLGPLFRI